MRSFVEFDERSVKRPAAEVVDQNVLFGVGLLSMTMPVFDRSRRRLIQQPHHRKPRGPEGVNGQEPLVRIRAYRHPQHHFNLLSCPELDIGSGQ